MEKIIDKIIWFCKNKPKAARLTGLGLCAVLVVSVVLIIAPKGGGGSHGVGGPVMTDTNGDPIIIDTGDDIINEQTERGEFGTDNTLPTWMVIQKEDGSFEIVNPQGEILENYEVRLDALGKVTLYDMNGKELTNVKINYTPHPKLMTFATTAATTTGPPPTMIEIETDEQGETVTDDGGNAVTRIVTVTTTAATTTAPNRPTEKGETTGITEPVKTYDYMLIELRDDIGKVPLVHLSRGDESARYEPDDKRVRIRRPGNYTIKGTLKDGTNLVIDTEGVVNITFAGVNITCSFDPPIRTSREQDSPDSALNFFIEPNTVNNIIDARAPFDFDAEEDPELESGLVVDDDPERHGAILSRGNLTITGSGTLNVTGGKSHGIRSRRHMTLSGANINIVSAHGFGIRARAGLTMNNSTISINATRKGIRSDGGAQSRITINGSKVNIVSGRDGIHGNLGVVIRNSEVTALVGGGLGAPPDPDASRRGIRAGLGGTLGELSIQQSKIQVNSANGALHSTANLTVFNSDITTMSGNSAFRGSPNITLMDSVIDIIAARRGLNARNGLLTINQCDIKIHSGNEAMVALNYSIDKNPVPSHCPGVGCDHGLSQRQ